MEPEQTELQPLLLDLLDRAYVFADNLMRPWNAYQIGIAIGLFLLATLLNAIIAPRVYEWLRSREGWPMWRRRIALILHKRIRFFLFVGLLWVTVLIMQELTWPSRSYLLRIIASIALAWLVISLASRMISSPFVRRVVNYGAAIWVTISLLNITEETQALLESAAISFAGTRVSAWMVVQGVVFVGFAIVIARLITKTSADRIERNEEISPSMRVLAVKFLQIVVYGTAILIGVSSIGFDLTGFAVLSGAIGVGIGFGLQKVVSNLISGVIILLDKSIKPGDVISLGETFGWINALGARYVSVVTRDGKEYLIPNEDLITGQVVNWSHTNQFVRLDIFFGTAYGDDPHKVRKIAIEAAMGVDRVLGDPRKPVCHIVGFGDSSVDYVLRFWISDPRGGLTNIRGNVYLALWDAFHEHGVSIPFPQREVKVLEGSSLETRNALPD